MEVSRYLGFILEPNLTKVAPDPTTPEELIVRWAIQQLLPSPSKQGGELAENNL